MLTGKAGGIPPLRHCTKLTFCPLTTDIRCAYIAVPWATAASITAVSPFKSSLDKRVELVSTLPATLEYAKLCSITKRRKERKGKENIAHGTFKRENKKMNS